MTAIDEIKSRVDIVDLISEYVQLQKAGRNYKALCPFHAEKTPSFVVSPDRQTWHCFGACGAGGDVIEFVVRRENVEFAEALRMLAQRAGVTLSERRDAREDERYQRLFDANEAAAVFFHNALLNATAARHARDYVAERGLDAEAIDAFQIGYAPNEWEALRSHLLDRGFTQQELIDAGLLVESERGGYDRFRGRLMFPIRDERGRVAGFGGRALESETGAKYVNTPQSPIFDKSGLLYALDRAKESIRREKTAVVVEGYMDVIAAHQHGMTNVVASMGTALTERQIRTLERLKANVLLALDADAAGMEATVRALREAEETGAVRAGASSIHPADVSEEEFTRNVQEWSRDALKRAAVNFYVVPLSGKDPDEMIRSDRDAWERAVANARPFTDHLFETFAARRDLTQPDERAELLEELLPVVRLIREPVYRAHCVQRLAARARVSEKAVWAELHRRERRRRNDGASPTATSPRARREPQEEFCLALLLRHDELRPDAAEISADLFSLSEHKLIFNAWRDTRDLDALRAALPDDVHPRLDAVLARDLPYYEGQMLRDALLDCVRRIELRRLSAAKQASAASLAELRREEVSAAVEHARTLMSQPPSSTDSLPPAEGDRRRWEIALALVEDMQVGRRLHLPPDRQASPAQHDAPQSEDAS